MKKERLRSAILDGNPTWKTEGPSLTSDGFSKLFDTIFDLAWTEGFSNGKAYAEMNVNPPDFASVFGDFLKGMKR